MLVGAGAERFADEAGHRARPDADRRGPADVAGRPRPPRAWRRRPTGTGRARSSYRRKVLERIAVMPPPAGPWGTVNVLALDAAGNLAAGVSTSGYPWKYPGRVR